MIARSTGAPMGTDRLRVGLLALTAVSGMVDAVSFLELGHTFTANMTGNVVFLAFAAAGAPDISVARSITSLAAFLSGAALGGYFGRGVAGLAADFALAGRSHARMTRRLGSIASLFAGAAMGAVLL